MTRKSFIATPCATAGYAIAMASDHDVVAIAARVRAALATGATLHEVLQALHGHAGLQRADIIGALVAIAQVDPPCARRLFDGAHHDRAFAHLGLSDLEL